MLDEVDQAWNYVLLYRERTTVEVAWRRGRGFVVERVLSNQQLAHDYLTRLTNG